jgi:hypothetical protein
MINRRDFVARSSGALLASCVPAIAMAGKAKSAGSLDVAAGLSKAQFMALLSQNFYVATRTDGVTVLQLVEVKDAASTTGRVKVDGFTLCFQGVASPALDDGMYTMEHGSVGKFELFIEQARMTPEFAQYRAQFCLLM